MSEKNDENAFWNIMDELIEKSELVEDRSELDKMIGSTDLFWNGKYGTIKYGNINIGVFKGDNWYVEKVNSICITEFDKPGCFYTLAYGCTKKQMSMYKAILRNTSKSGLILDRPSEIPNQKWIEYE